MNKGKRKFNANSSITRIAMTFAVLVIVPFILLSTGIALVFLNYTTEEIWSTMDSTVSTLGSLTRDQIQDYEDLSMSVYTHEWIEWLDDDRDLSEDEMQQINSSLAAISSSDTSIHAVYLYSKDREFMSGATYSRLLPIMEEYSDEIIATGGSCLWYPTRELMGNDGRMFYILARSLNSSEQKNVGILYMVVDDKVISNLINELTTDRTEIYLTNHQGTILQASKDAKQNESLDLESIPKNQIKANQKLTVDQETYICSSWKIMSLDWYCIAMTSEKNILADIIHMESYFIILAVIYGIILIMMLRMILKQYRREIDEKNRQKMNALSSQLTPHFIYNALNTIKWMAVLNHQENIQKLTESLVSIFMNAAKQDDGQYTIADEMDLIRNYSVVQKARFMNFELEMDVAEECLNCKIRKLLIQPIVENAIVHGLGRGKIKDTTIYIQVWMEEDLQIIVADEGMGFDVEKWRNEPDTSKEHTNIGLHNVEEIIQLEYGYPYGLEIDSKIGSGTTIHYHLPVIK